MNIRFLDPQKKECKKSCKNQSYYWFCKCDVSRDGVLTVWHSNYELLKQAIVNKKLKGKSWETTWGENLNIEDSSQNILTYLRSNEGDKVFSSYEQFKKIP